MIQLFGLSHGSFGSLQTRAPRTAWQRFCFGWCGWGIAPPNKLTVRKALTVLLVAFGVLMSQICFGEEPSNDVASVPAKWLAKQASLMGPDVRPQQVRNISIGMSLSELKAKRPHIVENTFLRSGDQETSFFERLPGGEFIEEAVYGIRNGKVSFIYLVGPPAGGGNAGLELQLKRFLQGIVAQNGARCRLQAIQKRIAKSAYEELGFIWEKKDGVQVAAAVPTFRTIEARRKQGVEEFQVACRFRLVIFDSKSLIGPTLVGGGGEWKEPDKSGMEDFFLSLAGLEK